MQFHQLNPKHKNASRKRVGRGGKKGKTSGFGVQKLGRSQPRIREVLKRYPKLRGYRISTVTEGVSALNIGKLEKKFETGATINPKILAEKRLVHMLAGKLPQVKILGQGELTKAFTFEGVFVSKSAKEKIEKAGGKIV